MAPRITVLILVLVFAAPAYLAAQDPVVAPGSRVRVYAPSINAEQFVGTVVGSKADTLTLDAEIWLDGVWKPRLDVAYAGMTSLELSRGRHSNAGKGALFGGITGAVAVAAAAFSGGGAWDGGVWARATIVVGLGTGVGALIGSLSHKEDWQAVPMDSPRIGPSPVSADGVSVSVYVRL